MNTRFEALETILRSEKTVFTFNELALLLNETNAVNLRGKIRNYIKKGKLYPIRRGIYGKNENYSKWELANKIQKPSYISFETILVKEGVIFQYYSSIFLASYQTREIVVDGQKYVYRKLKDTLLVNPEGLVWDGPFLRASKERALLDTIYLYGIQYFDQVHGVNWDKCFELLPIYNNKSMNQKFEKFHQLFKNAD